MSHLFNGHWQFEEQMSGLPYVGFIYVVKIWPEGKLYLGKKHFAVSRGKKKGDESDWRSYCSSSELLKDYLKIYGKTDFEFICLEQYTTKSGLCYAETKSLVLVDAPLSNIWLNKRIEEVSWNVKENMTQRHYNKLMELNEWRNKLKVHL